MFGAFGRARPRRRWCSLEGRGAGGLRNKFGIQKELYAVQNTRGKISKKSMIYNDATPDIEVDPETYEVRADGELLTCAPAEVLPMAQHFRSILSCRHRRASGKRGTYVQH